MTIEFTCEGCGKAMRAPEAAAGKKGQCPQCGVVNIIPSASSEPEPTEQPASADTVEFACESCGKTMRTPASAAGKKGKCPACGNVTTIPGPKDPVKKAPAAPAPKMPAKPAAPAAAPATAKKEPAAPLAAIEFYCPSCGSMVKTPGEVAGKKGKCPHCQAVVDIPKKSASRRPGTAPSAPASGGLTPIGGGGLTPVGGGLTPVGGGLTPVGGGLTPVGGGLTPVGGGLTPVGGGLTPVAGGGLTPVDSGLTPIGSAPSPFGGAPSPFGGAAPAAFPGDHLAGMGGPGFGGPGYGAPGFGPADFGANPYAAPAPAYSGSSRRAAEKPNDSKREGLPWERKGADASFFGTVTDVILRPAEAFSQMRRSGNTLMRAILFPFASMFLSVGILVLLIALFSGISLMIGVISAGDRLPEGGAARVFVAWIIATLLMATYLFGSSTLGLTVGLFLGAAIMHICLMIAGGARYSYEVTLRVICYSLGANYVVGAIPVVGIVTLMTYPMATIIGLAEAHETDKGRAAIAFFLPALLCFVLCVGFSFLGTFGPILGVLARLARPSM